MSDQTDTAYYQGGQPDKEKERGCDPPTPPPPPCPDPCAGKPHWGPPDIRPDCCPDDRCCCDKNTNKEHCCSWDEVEDPCVRASSCGGEWTKIECTCKSHNEKCNCDEWDCGCYPQPTCVPCKPCDGLLPNGPDTPPPDTPPADGCAGALQKELTDLQKAITSKQTDKGRIEAEIKAGQDREKDLTKLIADFATLVDKYSSERQKLINREECLKSFYRNTAQVFDQEFSDDCKKAMRAAINAQLCGLESAKCCQQSLDGKLAKVTRLIWEQQKAQTDLQKAEDAFKAIKDFPKWVGDQFTALEALKDLITKALSDKDPLQHRWAFYLFYWKFVPGLCRRFPIAICCGEKSDKPTQEGSTQDASYDEHTTDRIGCERGDWHPSVITIDKLAKLICCAAAKVKCKKDKLQEKNLEVETVKNNLDYIKRTIDAKEKSLEDDIRKQVNAVDCKPAASTK